MELASRRSAFRAVHIDHTCTVTPTRSGTPRSAARVEEALAHDRQISADPRAREWSMAKAQFAVIFGERFIKAMAA